MVGNIHDPGQKCKGEGKGGGKFLLREWPTFFGKFLFKFA